jgi:diguanylate cyclase (GGDEF)-like protein/PAS domain S-box-containing protein
MADSREAHSAASLVEALPLVVVDPEGVVLDVGGQDCGIAGHRARALLGSCLLDLVHPEDAVIVTDHFETVRDGRVAAADVRARLRGPDGAFRDVALGFHAIAASDDVLVWARDVTTSAMVQEALQASVLHSALVEHTRSLLAVFEPDGRLRFFNPAALEVFGNTMVGVDGTARLTDIVHPDDVVDAEARFAEALANPRRRVPCEVRIRRGDEWRTLQVVLVNLVEDPAVGGVVVDGVDATEQLDLAHRALHDPLTGVANRVLLSDRLTHAMSRLERTRRPLLVAYVDLDRFKTINDRLGHDTGDAVLVEVAARLSASVRPGDTVARIGGDEFVVLCPDLPDAGRGDDLALRLVEAVAEPLSLGGEQRVVTASVGLVLVHRPATTDHVLRAADAAMYRAKRAGGNLGVWSGC